MPEGPTNTLLTKFGNDAPTTQKVIPVDEGVLFESYGTPIALKYHGGQIGLYPHWDASQTTVYYRNQFLGENTAETRRNLENGTYEKVGKGWMS